MKMSSSQPYIIRAFYEWICDNGFTPYIVVNASAEGAYVPQEHVEDGRIVLNISPTATQQLLIGNSIIEFNARFSGSPMQVSFPVSAVTAIYARENGRGMVFPA